MTNPFLPRVYGLSISGNCHKVRQLLEWTNRPYEWIETDSNAGATRTPEFLALNPNGKVPLAELAPGRWLAESNAIMVYLAEGTPWYPATDAWARAEVLQWLFFEQYSHEPYIAVARFIVIATPADSPRRAELPRLLEKGHQALAVMEQHLGAGRDWFVGTAPTVADVALAAYTASAAVAGFEMQRFPAVTAWLARLKGVPGYTETPTPAPMV